MVISYCWFPIYHLWVGILSMSCNHIVMSELYVKSFNIPVMYLGIGIFTMLTNKNLLLGDKPKHKRLNFNDLHVFEIMLVSIKDFCGSHVFLFFSPGVSRGFTGLGKQLIFLVFVSLLLLCYFGRMFRFELCHSIILKKNERYALKAVYFSALLFNHNCC